MLDPYVRFKILFSSNLVTYRREKYLHKTRALSVDLPEKSLRQRKVLINDIANRISTKFINAYNCIRAL